MSEKAPYWGQNQIGELARAQHGYVTRRQLLELGLGAKAVAYRVRRGQLIRVYAGVYAVGHAPTLDLDRAHAALLACGTGAVLSHSSAGAAWGICERFETPFEVTTPTLRDRPGIRTYRSALPRCDVKRTRGLPVTSAARTLLDLAPRLPARQLERAADEMRRRGYLRTGELAAVAPPASRHPGAAAIRALLAEPHNPTRSEFELDFIGFVKRYGLPMPVINARVGGYEVDALFADERVIVELDGWSFHGSRASFRNDRARDARLLALGYVTIRITWERLREEPEVVAAELVEVLAARGAGGFLRSGS